MRKVRARKGPKRHAPCYKFDSKGEVERNFRSFAIKRIGRSALGRKLLNLGKM